MKFSDERVYRTLLDCGGHPGWAAKKLGRPSGVINDAISRLVAAHLAGPAVDDVYESRKHAALAELSRLESVR